jgi:glutamate---cysteine ligase / carboxylate-amine ligase
VTPLDADSLRTIFDAPAPMTVGIEEELMLLDPETLDLAPRARELLERVQAGAVEDGEPVRDGRFKLEMPAAQFEIASPALKDAAAASEFLHAARTDLARAGDGLVRLACSGVHPFAVEEGELNAGERYKRVAGEYGRFARRQLVFGLQVHVAIRPAERALAVYNGLRHHLPELLALASNSPYYRGEDTGLAAIRPKLCELLPRQGVPPPLASWEQYAEALAWGAKAGTIPEHGIWWWELRPHPNFGTLEVRVPDAQRTVEEAAAVVATVHCLAAELAEQHEQGAEQRPHAPTWRIQENRWQALRHGLDGTLADLESGEPQPTRDRLTSLLDSLAAQAAKLGCERELAHAHKLVERNGAARQREVHANAGIHGLTEWLVTGFEEPPTGQR